jgi:hypothetical protein
MNISVVARGQSAARYCLNRYLPVDDGDCIKAIGDAGEQPVNGCYSVRIGWASAWSSVRFQLAPTALLAKSRPSRKR